MTLKDIDIDKLKIEIKNFNSFTSLSKAINYQSITRLKKFCIKHNINFSHFKNIKIKSTLSNLLKENTPTSSHRLKIRLIEEKLKEHKCENCNLNEWLCKPISLELHHINGINTDNRLENLIILCPNCHSFTENYKVKNRNFKKKTEEEYLKAIKSSKSIKEACIFLGLKPSGNNYSTIKSKMKKYNIFYEKDLIIEIPKINIKLEINKLVKKGAGNKIVWPSREELEKLFLTMKMEDLSKCLGVSRKTLSKKRKELSIIRPNSGFWRQKTEEAVGLAPTTHE